MKITLLILLIIPIAFFQLMILSDIVDTSHRLRKARKVKKHKLNYEDESKRLLQRAN